MLERIRRRRAQEGFTLIELLVVVIIIGLLAAIAIPAFLGQRNKANDAAAKSLVRNGATAMEAFFSDANTYLAADDAKLKAIEPNIVWKATGALAKGDEVGYGTPTATTYVLSTTSASGAVFTYSKNLASTPTVTRTCTGCSTGTW